MTIKQTITNTDILRKIRHGETFETDHAEFNFFMYKLAMKPEYKIVRYTMEIDSQKITISPVKTAKFYRTFKVLAGVVLTGKLIQGVQRWGRKFKLK